MLLILLTLSALPFAFQRESAQAESGNGPIATVALRTVGTYGGQCWTWMQQVVAEATGRQIGFDYRQGFFEAGAYEVSASEAQNGDIIQVASDADTSPWASYPGLHTAVILKNLGGGRFDAIDSNQNWDEMVNLRPNYDPYASAARYGLQVHIYRVPGGGPSDAGVASQSSNPPASVDTSNTPGSVHTWWTGDQGVVATNGCLNLRSQPSLSAAKIDCLPTGTAVTVTDSPVAADGYIWVKVNTARGQGWVAAQYLSVTVPAASPPPPTPEPAAPPLPSSPAPAAADTPATSTAARVDGSPGCLRVRDGATLGGAILNCLAPNSAVTLAGDSDVRADGYTWVHISAPTNGWVAGEYLVR